MSKFHWSVGVFCEKSNFCGLGLNLDDHDLVIGSNIYEPSSEICQILVDSTKQTCNDVIQKILDSKLIRRTVERCLFAKWEEFCMRNYMSHCRELNGQGFGLVCNGSVEAVESDKNYTTDGRQEIFEQKPTIGFPASHENPTDVESTTSVFPTTHYKLTEAKPITIGFPTSHEKPTAKSSTIGPPTSHENPTGRVQMFLTIFF
ncbi:uncharacterized protein LOC142356744 [Convolutriloba macropyga]|uniref:uncharacterized protein LOC142356744 n=1 Tax=Convolutriloba macropyga TaxID=536237 RepID=UPI003F5253D8